MSKSMFANPKAALGFAGVTIAIAVAASFAAGAYLPDGAVQEEAVAQVETPPAPSAPATPAPQMAWADEDFADDWNSSAVDSATGVATDSAPTSTGEPVFGEYSPSAEQEGPATQSRSPRSSASASSSGPRITTRAAPGVAPARAPNAGEPGELLTAD